MAVPVAIDDTLVVQESEAGGDIDGNVTSNDINPSGPPLPVITVNGVPTKVGVPVPGSSGGLFTFHSDGTFDFDANGDFDGLSAGATMNTTASYGISFVGAASQVDVVLFEDLSGSFYDDLPNVSAQFSSLYDTLNTDRDVDFGVAIFIDKGESVYQTEQPVSGDKSVVQSALDTLVLGGGGDYPEAQFEGLLHLAKRADGEVGFREGSQRIVVLSTDAPPHLAGDASYLDPNDGDAVIENEDYPTVEQVKQALIDANITPIFSVTSDVISVYQDLVTQLGRGVVVELTSDSSNLASAIKDALETISTVDDALVTVTVTGEGDGVGPSLPDCDVVQRADTLDGSPSANQTLTGVAGPNTFFFSVPTNSGQDEITNFGKSDVLVTDKALVDSNGDGFITFGNGGLLHLDGPNTGDTVKLDGIDPAKGLRVLGTDDGECFVYADATVRPLGAQEGTLDKHDLAGDVGDAAKQVFFFDTALDINLGQANITNFGAKDLLVTTTKIFDSNNDGIIGFGGDNILDLPGGTGKVTINAQAVTSLHFDGVTTHNGVEYYVYSKVGAPADTHLDFIA